LRFICDIVISSSPRKAGRRQRAIDLSLDPVGQSLGCRRRRRVALIHVDGRQHSVVWNGWSKTQPELRSALIEACARERRQSQRRRIGCARLSNERRRDCIDLASFRR
jgi:hypothetical protein